MNCSTLELQWAVLSGPRSPWVKLGYGQRRSNLRNPFHLCGSAVNHPPVAVIDTELPMQKTSKMSMLVVVNACGITMILMLLLYKLCCCGRRYLLSDTNNAAVFENPSIAAVTAATEPGLAQLLSADASSLDTDDIHMHRFCLNDDVADEFRSHPSWKKSATSPSSENCFLARAAPNRGRPTLRLPIGRSWAGAACSKLLNRRPAPGRYCNHRFSFINNGELAKRSIARSRGIQAGGRAEGDGTEPRGATAGNSRPRFGS